MSDVAVDSAAVVESPTQPQLSPGRQAMQRFLQQAEAIQELYETFLRVSEVMKTRPTAEFGLELSKQFPGADENNTDFRLKFEGVLIHNLIVSRLESALRDTKATLEEAIARISEKRPEN